MESAGSRGLTEVSIIGRYEANELPLPRALIGVALEVVVQKVAEKMRRMIETASEPDRPLAQSSNMNFSWRDGGGALRGARSGERLS